jgi:hypothetical protein
MQGLVFADLLRASALIHVCFLRVYVCMHGFFFACVYIFAGVCTFYGSCSNKHFIMVLG